MLNFKRVILTISRNNYKPNSKKFCTATGNIFSLPENFSADKYF